MIRMNVKNALQTVCRYEEAGTLGPEEFIEYTDALMYLIENYPYDSENWLLQLAEAYNSIEKYDLAVKYYKKAISAGILLGYMGLGDAYRNLGEYRKAEECYEKALEAGYPRAKEKIKKVKEAG